jgi:hypothetical protein
MIEWHSCWFEKMRIFQLEDANPNLHVPPVVYPVTQSSKHQIKSITKETKATKVVYDFVCQRDKGGIWLHMMAYDSSNVPEADRRDPFLSIARFRTTTEPTTRQAQPS